jgi:hypothetical protein
VYQKALSLLYVDELLAAVRVEFASCYTPGVSLGVGLSSEVMAWTKQM